VGLLDSCGSRDRASWMDSWLYDRSTIFMATKTCVSCGQTDTSICGKRAAGITADVNLRPNRKSPQDSGISIEQPTCSHLTCMLHHLVKRPSCKCQSLLPRVHGRPGRHLSCAGHLPSYTPMSSNKAAACCQSFSCSHALA
jgi:hypothetical protein